MVLFIWCGVGLWRALAVLCMHGCQLFFATLCLCVQRLFIPALVLANITPPVILCRYARVLVGVALDPCVVLPIWIPIH